MFQASNLRFIHLHRAKLYTLLDGNPADVTDDLLTILDGHRLQLFKRCSRRLDGFIRIMEHTMTSNQTTTRNNRGSAYFGQHLADHIAY